MGHVIMLLLKGRGHGGPSDTPTGLLPKTVRIRTDDAQVGGFQGKPNPADGILVER